MNQADTVDMNCICTIIPFHGADQLVPGGEAHPPQADADQNEHNQYKNPFTFHKCLHSQKNNGDMDPVGLPHPGGAGVGF